jgi:hypothetical protein
MLARCRRPPAKGCASRVENFAFREGFDSVPLSNLDGNFGS